MRSLLTIASVANPDRPDDDRQRDADRKLAEALTFVGIKNGEKVADFIPGKGYVSRLLSSAVGPQGHVYAFVPSEFANFIKQPLPADGSRLDGESDALHNAGDPRTANVKYPAIRGRTDYHSG
jgi:predicted methyltransferase